MLSVWADTATWYKKNIWIVFLLWLRSYACDARYSVAAKHACHSWVTHVSNDRCVNVSLQKVIFTADRTHSFDATTEINGAWFIYVFQLWVSLIWQVVTVFLSYVFRLHIFLCDHYLSCIHLILIFLKSFHLELKFYNMNYNFT